jgi:transcriptional regulator of NAD metabolism
MTDRFAVSVREIATIEGLPDYPFVVIDHPIAGNPTDELHAKAERALASIVSLMTTRKA